MSDSAHDDHVHGHEGPDEVTLRVHALEALLTARGLIDPAAIDALIDTYEHKVGPHVGAQLVAKAWTDSEFKHRLLEEPNAVLAEQGVSRLQSEDMVVLENTPSVHNVIVCTLCSCYPWSVLGLPPNWYKSPPYRSRIVREPRAVLREFGFEVPASLEVRVWDSTAELRYMVLPLRPAGTEGMDVDTLASLVTRDSMLGVGAPRSPSSSEAARNAAL